MINENLITTSVSAKSWREVVCIAGDLLVENNLTSAEFTDSMIKTVEDLGPYMILLPKVAFFHAPPSEAVKETGLSLVVLENSVFFDDFDNQEIKCSFAFCAIDSNSHLEMLQKFSVLLGNEEMINLLVNNGSKEEILKLMEEMN